MHVDKVVSMANRAVEIPFRAMERSLRATGSQLPIWVIPYDDDLFDLPDGSHWWVEDEFFAWIDRHGAHPMMRKYLALTTTAFQFADADIIFLDDPGVTLASCSGVVSACTEWNKPAWTVTPDSARLFSTRSSTWQQDVVSAGQFACEEQLYSSEALKELAADPRYQSTILGFLHHDQPGINLLIFLAGAEVTNLTLPPARMPSTWAGDYPAGYDELWTDRRPYLVHWAGVGLGAGRPIDQLFFDHLTAEERAAWHRREAGRREEGRQSERWPLWIRLLNRVVPRIDERFHVAWRVEK